MDFSKYFTLVALIVIQPVQASIFSRIDEVTLEKIPGQPAYYKYNYTISSWTSESDNQINPCYNWSQGGCYLHISHRHYEDGTSGGPDDTPYVNIVNDKTIGDVRKHWISEAPLPISGVTYHYDSGEKNVQECVGLFYAAAVHATNATLFPTSVCGIAPPPVGHCQLEGNTTIDYGSVSASTLNGEKRSSTATVTCDMDMSVDVWLMNPTDNTDTVLLRQDGSIATKLTLDNENAAKAGKNVTAKAGEPVPLTITSEAIVTGTPEAGEFSGSAIMMLSIP